MHDLFSLLHSLTSSEWQALQGYLTYFTNHSPTKSKYLQLAHILMNAQECPEEAACCLKIYGVKKDGGFKKLKSRLKEKILDFLLTDISPDKQQELDEADYNIIKIKKKSAQFQQLYYSKKRMPMLYDLLDEIIFMAKKYEQYSLLVDHLRLKKALVNWKTGKKDFKKTNEEMKYAAQCSSIYNRAEHYYYELMMIGDLSGKLDNQKILLELKNNISEIRAGFELTHSPMIHYYLKNLEMSYYQLEENYPHARSMCLELLSIVRNNKSVYRRQRVGVVYDNLSRCEFYLGNFTTAVKCARQAQKSFNQGSENYCIALEQEFYALFAMKQYEQSTMVANKMIASATREELGKFRYSKYNYLLANALFMQHKFKETLGLLSEEREISRDKAGWETGARVLTIMTLIEIEKHDEASVAIIGLKQFFKRTDKKTPISKRDKTILNLWLILERTGFVFARLPNSAQKHLGALQSTDAHTAWEPFTPEIIPFHNWFTEKTGKAVPLPGPKEKELVLVEAVKVKE